MPYLRIRQNWQITVKESHTFHLDVKEGFANDTLKLFVDDELVVKAKAGISGWKGYALFDVDGRTHELRWSWNMWSGNPESIVVMHKGRILAQYGSDRASEDDIIEGS
ncbi:MAG: hypothetical protein Phog2KO_06280 [Phototrophicaceae bacterium]